MDGYVILLALGAMIVLGHFMGKLFDKIKLPEVTGFIVTGILIHLLLRFGLNLENELHEAIDAFQIVVTIALSFVSFIIGTKLWKPKVKELSKGIFPVLILQLLFVVVFTSLSFLIVEDIQFALLIGAISAATAPAPIIEITNKYASRGSLTETLTAIVGFDNIIGITYFFIIAAIAPQIGTGVAFSFTPVLQAILGSLIAVGIGALAGVVLALFDKNSFNKYKAHEKHESYLIVSVGIIILAAIGAHVLDRFLPATIIPSPYIATLILGAVFTNLTDRDTYEYETVVIGEFVPPLITAFFVIAGMELDVTQLFSSIGLFAILYVLTHSAGKFLGAYVGTRINKSSPKLQKHLPYAGLTQGGFEIVLAMVAAQILGKPEIKLIVLTAVLIFEFIAPMLLTKAIHNADEVSFVSIGDATQKETKAIES